MPTSPDHPTVLLFDIDGTLVDTAGAGRRAVDRAFAELHGRADACAGLHFGGLTDPFIARHGLGAIAAPCDDRAIAQLLDVYVGHLEDELARSEACRALPGLPALLDALLPHGPAGGGRVALGLGTGNVERGARLKLRRVGLDHYFGFGGFGCDAEDRGALLAAGARRGADQLGVGLAACRVVVIGDTPLDVRAARAIGAECVAVTTGRHDARTLAAEHPDAVVPDLTHPDVPGLLLGRARAASGTRQP